MGRHCSRATPGCGDRLRKLGLAAGLAGTWGVPVLAPGFTPCPAPLSSQKKSKAHYHIAVIINYLGHCISLVAPSLVAFVLFLRLR